MTDKEIYDKERSISELHFLVQNLETGLVTNDKNLRYFVFKSINSMSERHLRMCLDVFILMLEHEPNSDMRPKK